MLGLFNNTIKYKIKIRTIFQYIDTFKKKNYFKELFVQ